MRRFLVAALAVLLLSPLALAKDVAQPAPVAGDFWAFDVGGAQSGTLNVTYNGTEPQQVGGATVQALRYEWRNGGGIVGGQTNWYAASDFGKLRVDIQDAAGTTSYTLDSPCAEWQFPLAVGKAWNTTCTFHAAGQPDLVITSTWRVLREENVTVPAGTFDAVVLEQVDVGSGYRSQWWFSPQACYYVQEKDLDPNGATTHTEALRSYHCAAPAATPVGTTPASSTPASSTPAASTPASSTSSGSTPASSSPAASTPAGSTPASGTPEGGASPTAKSPAPGAALVAAAIAGAAILLARRSKRS